MNEELPRGATEIKKLAAQFIQRESNRISLITVTDVLLQNRSKNASIFVTILPEMKQNEGIDFLKRKRGDFRVFVKKNSRLKIVPFFDFELDLGEKNRQRIDELSREG